MYKQIYGIPMGSPLSPIIANMVLNDIETTLIIELNNNIGIYRRCMDDIILTAEEKDFENILETFNGVHNRLQITYEKESFNTKIIKFLDLTLRRKNQKIITNWFRKDNKSERYLNFLSNMSNMYKISTINALVDEQ